MKQILAVIILALAGNAAAATYTPPAVTFPASMLTTAAQKKSMEEFRAAQDAESKSYATAQRHALKVRTKFMEHASAADIELMDLQERVAQLEAMQ